MNTIIFSTVKEELINVVFKRVKGRYQIVLVFPFQLIQLAF